MLFFFSHTILRFIVVRVRHQADSFKPTDSRKMLDGFFARQNLCYFNVGSHSFMEVFIQCDSLAVSLHLITNGTAIREPFSWFGPGYNFLQSLQCSLSCTLKRAGWWPVTGRLP